MTQLQLTNGPHIGNGWFRKNCRIINLCGSATAGTHNGADTKAIPKSGTMSGTILYGQDGLPIRMIGLIKAH